MAKKEVNTAREEQRSELMDINQVNPTKNPRTLRIQRRGP